MKLLIKFPTRGRPDQFKYTLFQYVSKCADKKNTKFLFTFDNDDPTADDEQFMEEFHEICGEMEYQMPYGLSDNKIHAVNRCMDMDTDWDILLLASDDMIPVVKGYDTIIREKMADHYPDLDGVLWFNDGYTEDRLNTLVICGRAYYDRFGYIYNPIYKSFFCDNEFMDTANALKKQTYFSQCIIRHQHPGNTGVPADELYRRNDRYWKEDQRTYFQRKAYEADLSVLICSLEERKNSLSHLLNRLSKCNPHTLRIEILTNIDNREKTIGAKRNELLARAKGKYCCFIDDDDDIDLDYFAEIEAVIKANPDADCVSMIGLYQVNGVYEKPFLHSINIHSYREDKDGYYRFPNHLNPILTGYAKQIGFTNKSHGEDTDFATNLYKARLLQNEAQVRKPLYIYQFVPK